MTKVKQVARAIASARWEIYGNEKVDPAEAYDMTNNTGRFAFDEMARAAIQAMRNPTDKMCVSGEDQCGEYGCSHSRMREIFKAMIDAALSETSEAPHDE